MPDPITDLAMQLVDQPIDDVPRYRLLRDILHEPDASSRVQEAYTAAMNTPQVLWLADAQQADGSWGRLLQTSLTTGRHDARAAVRRTSKAVNSTDSALLRAFSLGMNHRHPAIVRAITYLERLLSDSAVEPEQNTSIQVNDVERRIRVAGQLRLFDENNPLALQVADRWIQLIMAAFENGAFDELRYRVVFEQIFGQPAAHDSNLAFSGPVLMLLRGLLPYPVEESYISHIIEEERGIAGVHHHALHHLPLDFPSMETTRFLTALDLLAFYPSAGRFLEDAKTWLWEQLNPAGRWDLGKTGHDGVYLPMSSSWRRPFDREVDSTVRLLLILQRMQNSCDLRLRLCHPR